MDRKKSIKKTKEKESQESHPWINEEEGRGIEVFKDFFNLTTD